MNTRLTKAVWVVAIGLGLLGMVYLTLVALWIVHLNMVWGDR